ncbi:hypothetical protein [Stenotrophomonas sp. 278]|uniref:hypothetical protein n=1 Tax=Stenotrophomonas sp. 278 TaxID=2479851 RepID=UPI000F66E454|nr:hypothetical protein [Stenotrophomonas sp. 278]RRU23520.1 hypothetical protein EGJ34_03070 [Stenotrophomonas sp. 278]
MNSKKRTTRASSSAKNQFGPVVVEGLIDLGDGTLLLPADLYGKPVPIQAPLWTETPDGTAKVTFKFLLNENPFNEWDGPPPVTEDMLKSFIDADRLEGEGTHELWYQVQFDEGEVVPANPRVKIVVDKVPPTLDDPDLLLFATSVEQDGVTREYLDSNSNVLPATLNYAAASPHDVVKVYWDTTADEDNEVLAVTLQAADVGNPITLNIPAAAIEASGDGARHVRYVIFDRAGNGSGFSGYKGLTVKLDDEEVPEDGLLDAPFLHAEDVADPADGTIKGAIVVDQVGLRIRIPAWANLPLPNETQTIQLNAARGHDEENAEYHLAALLDVTGPVDEATDFPLEVVLPPQFLSPDGPLLVRYQVVLWTGDPTDSRAIKLIADGTPPWGQAYPDEAVVPAEDITDAYFDANPTGVKWTLPDYAAFQPGDMLLYWWLNTLPDDVDGLPPTGTQAVTQPPMDLEVPKAHVDATGDGGCYLVYVVVDKAGNQSNISKYQRLKVALGELPTSLAPPTFPQAATDGVIDLLDVHEGAIVAIPLFENVKPTDRISVTWGSTELEGEQVGTAPGWPLKIRIPSDVVRIEYNDAQGPVATTVSYVVYRGDVVFGPETATVQVDISVAGPDLPDFPDPVNGNLKLGEALGNTSQTPNVIDITDAGQPATFTIPMYANPVAGEEIRVYWGEVLAGTYPVDGTEAVDDPIVVSIPWDIIVEVGNNPTLDVHYRIGTAASPNEQHSQMTVVSVDAVQLVPEAPVYVGTTTAPGGADALTCSSLQGAEHAVHVEVPDLSKWLGEGDIVTLTWTPYDAEGGAELTAAIKVEDITLTAAQLAGFTWAVEPYATHILPTYESPTNRSGWASTVYAFEFEGRTATSLPAEAEVHMYYAGGSCPLD